jgi:hypothetical protein
MEKRAADEARGERAGRTKGERDDFGMMRKIFSFIDDRGQ